MANAPMVSVPPIVSAARAQEQHGDDAKRYEQAAGGPVVEQPGRPGEARRPACSPVDSCSRLIITLSHPPEMSLAGPNAVLSHSPQGSRRRGIT